MENNEKPEVAIYDLTNDSGWNDLHTSLLKHPHLIHLADWHISQPKEQIKEALERNLILDTLPEFVKGIEKIKETKAYFASKSKPYLFPKTISTDWNTACAVEFPWRTGEGRYVILPKKEAFLFLTTSRNQMLIPDKAQKAFQTLKVGFAGAGVGSSLLEGVVRAGVQNVVIADGGDISFHDLNRLQSPTVTSVGQNHAIHAAQKALEANPFLHIKCIAQNLGETETDTTVSIDSFLDGLAIVFEEVDNVAIKIAIREQARKRGIPVIMATDIGFGTIIEFQKGEIDAPIFPLLSDADKQKLKENKNMSLSDKTAIAVKMVGEEANYWQGGVANGLTFWSQTGAAADASKAKAVETLVKWIMGEDIPTKQTYL